MQSKFCLACNAENKFADSVPRFCQSCGSPFGGTTASQTKPIQVVRPIKRAVARQIQQESEEIIPDEEYNEIPHHGDFKIEIEYTKPQRERETLRGLALDKSERANIHRPKQKDLKNKKKFLESWEQDFNKATRKNSTEIGGNF